MDTHICILLSHRLDTPDGRAPQFDEQDICPPDAEVGDDDRMMMEAVLALIPPNMVASSALRANRQVLLIFGQMYYKRIYAGYDKQIVADALDGRIHNPESTSADFLFIGGSAAVHTQEQITDCAERLQRMIYRHDYEHWEATIEQFLTRYDRIVYTQDGDVYVLVRPDPATIADIRSLLNAVAARYGLVLPKDKFPIERSAGNDRANTS